MSTTTRLRPQQRASDTFLALRGMFRRLDTVAVFLAVTVGYATLYLWAIADLTVQSTGGIAVDVVAPLDRAFQRGPGRFAYEGIAIVDLAVARYIFSPVNTAIGLGMGALVGVSFALSYLAYVRPASCGVGASSGVLAAIPAALSGGACCAPVLFIVLGVTATGATLTIVTWLLPISALLLLATIVYLAGKIDQTALRA